VFQPAVVTAEFRRINHVFSRKKYPLNDWKPSHDYALIKCGGELAGLLAASYGARDHGNIE
jgi:hypothetical protein